jgi:hypothetical protein
MALRLCVKGIFERVHDIPAAWRQKFGIREVV